jgi:hypothetical protein
LLSEISDAGRSGQVTVAEKEFLGCFGMTRSVVTPAYRLPIVQIAIGIGTLCSFDPPIIALIQNKPISSKSNAYTKNSPFINRKPIKA